MLNPNSSRLSTSREVRTGDSASLEWAEQDIILTGESDLSKLRNLRNVVLALRDEFGSKSIKLPEGVKDDFGKRLLLVEGEIEGLMKRKINYTIKDQNGERYLDYATLLNEK